MGSVPTDCCLDPEPPPPSPPARHLVARVPVRILESVSSRRDIASGALVFGVTAPFFYLAIRAVEHLRGQASMAMVLVSTSPPAFFFRALDAVFLAGVAAIVAHLTIAVNTERQRALVAAITRVALPLAAAAILSAWILP